MAVPAESQTLGGWAREKTDPAIVKLTRGFFYGYNKNRYGFPKKRKAT